MIRPRPRLRRPPAPLTRRPREFGFWQWNDDLDTCEVIGRILQEAGAEVASAHCAEKALAELEEFPPEPWLVT